MHAQVRVRFVHDLGLSASKSLHAHGRHVEEACQQHEADISAQPGVAIGTASHGTLHNVLFQDCVIDAAPGASAFSEQL